MIEHLIGHSIRCLGMEGSERATGYVIPAWHGEEQGLESTSWSSSISRSAEAGKGYLAEPPGNKIHSQIPFMWWSVGPKAVCPKEKEIDTVSSIGTYIWGNLGYATEHDIRSRALESGLLRPLANFRGRAGHRDIDPHIWKHLQLRSWMGSGSRRREPDTLPEASRPVVGSFWNLLEGICEY